MLKQGPDNREIGNAPHDQTGAASSSFQRQMDTAVSSDAKMEPSGLKSLETIRIMWDRKIPTAAIFSPPSSNLVIFPLYRMCSPCFCRHYRPYRLQKEIMVTRVHVREDLRPSTCTGFTMW